MPVTISEIVRELRKGEGSYVRHGSGRDAGRRVRPLEIWIPTIKVWMRADGSYFSSDITRDFQHGYPGWWSRLRIRMAVRAWEDQTGAFWEGDE